MLRWGGLKSWGKRVSGPRGSTLKFPDKEAVRSGSCGATGSRFASAKFSLLDQDLGCAAESSRECILIYSKQSRSRQEGSVSIKGRLFSDLFQAKSRIECYLSLRSTLFCFVVPRGCSVALQGKFFDEFYKKNPATGEDLYPLNSLCELSPKHRASFIKELKQAGFSFRDYATVEETEEALRHRTVQRSESVGLKEREEKRYAPGSDVTGSERILTGTELETGRLVKSKLTQANWLASIADGKLSPLAPLRRTLSAARKRVLGALQNGSGARPSVRHTHAEEIHRPVVHCISPERVSGKVDVTSAERSFPVMTGLEATSDVGVTMRSNISKTDIGVCRAASMSTHTSGPCEVQEQAVSRQAVLPISSSTLGLFGYARKREKVLQDDDFRNNEIAPLAWSILGLKGQLTKVEAHIDKLDRCCQRGDAVAGKKARIWSVVKDQLNRLPDVEWQIQGLQGERLKANVHRVQEDILAAKGFLTKEFHMLSRHRSQFWNRPFFYVVKHIGFEKCLERRVTSLKMFDVLKRELESCEEHCRLVMSPQKM